MEEEGKILAGGRCPDDQRREHSGDAADVPDDDPCAEGCDQPRERGAADDECRDEGGGGEGLGGGTHTAYPAGEGFGRDWAACRSTFGRGDPKIRSSAVTDPFVAPTIALIIPALGSWSPYNSRVIDATVVSAATASLATVWPSSERYWSNVMIRHLRPGVM